MTLSPTILHNASRTTHNGVTLCTCTDVHVLLIIMFVLSPTSRYSYRFFHISIIDNLIYANHQPTLYHQLIMWHITCKNYCNYI